MTHLRPLPLIAILAVMFAAPALAQDTRAFTTEVALDVRSPSVAAMSEDGARIAAGSVVLHDVPEATVETLCSLGSASMAFGKLALTGGGAEVLESSTRRAAQAAVKRALDAFEEACGLCDSTCVELYGPNGLEVA